MNTALCFRFPALIAATLVFAAPSHAEAEYKPKDAAEQQQTATPRLIDIDEYVIEGVDLLPQTEVEAAVYPYLGPQRSTTDVEKARGALEKAYHEKGYQTVVVEIPPQNAENGIVKLKVTEGKVGRLSVNNAKYHSPELIRKKAPSVAEGKVLNVNELQKDLVALNQWPDRRVVPALRAGAAPGTVDVDLNVEEKNPLHGSIEFNNRQSPSTTATRINTTLRYDNLWQAGHSISFSYGVAPERPDDMQSYSASYLFRVPGNDFLSFMTYGVKSTSDVMSVGDIRVIGPGTIIGERVMLTLPSKDNLYHSVSLGVDYKRFEQDVSLVGIGVSRTPIEYYPFSATYSGVIINDKNKTEITAGVTFGLRSAGLGSDAVDYDNKRFKSDANFFYLRGDIAHTHELLYDFEGFAKLRGQFSGSPLVSNEQFSAGGLDSVRGYLESEVLGDTAVGGTVELRTPNLATLFANLGESAKEGDAKLSEAASSTSYVNEWRIYAFYDHAFATIHDPLPEQTREFNLASYGVGTKAKILDHFNGSADFAIPLTSQAVTRKHEGRLMFRIWGEF